jgi:hypothetical protein
VTTDTAQTITGAKTFTGHTTLFTNTAAAPSTREVASFANSGARLAITSTSATSGSAVNDILSTSGGAEVGSAALSFSTRSAFVVAERMRIAANGNVGIGTASPSALFNLASSGVGITQVFSRLLVPPGGISVLGTLDFTAYSTGTTLETGARIRALSDAGWSSTSSPARIEFSTTPSGSTTLVERMRIAADGTVQLPSGSPGIKFGTRNANLDDYEEGTWTTTFSGLTNLTGTAVLDGAHFTKIGRVVYIAARINGLSITSSSTQTSIVLTLPAGLGTAGNTLRMLGVTRLSQGVVVGYVANNTGSNNTQIVLVFRAGAVVSTGSTVIDFSLTYIS